MIRLALTGDCEIGRRQGHGGLPACVSSSRLLLWPHAILRRCRLRRPFLLRDQALRPGAAAIGAGGGEAEVGRHVENAEERDVAMVAPGPFERLLFALFAPVRAEHAGPVADELVAVDDAPVAWIVDDADVRLRWLLFALG